MAINIFEYLTHQSPQRRKTAIGMVVAVLLVAFAVATFRFFVPAFLLPEISYQSSPEVGDEVVVKFLPLVSERQAKAAFRIDPEIPGELVWLGEYRELHFVPLDGFRANSEYRVSVIPQIPLFASPSAHLQVFAFVPGKLEVPAGPSETAPASGKFLDVNISTMVLTLIQDGQVLEAFPVAGKGNPWLKPTREGTFRILSKEDRHWSRLYRLWMPLSMNYSEGYFIHGWPYWPNGARLTSRYSGGCIRLTDDVAQKVYAWVDAGTPVRIHSTPGRVSVFSPDLVEDGDLVREISDSKVFVVKHAGEKRFKRHVRSEKFADWYPHLSPLWAKIKTVPNGTLSSYLESRWVLSSDASDNFGNRFIFEIDPQGTKHLISCAPIPGGTPVSPAYCKAAWQVYGWDQGELFSASARELESYPAGEAIELPPATRP